MECSRIDLRSAEIIVQENGRYLGELPLQPADPDYHRVRTGFGRCVEVCPATIDIIMMNKQLADIQALLIDLDGVIRIWDPANDKRAEESAGLPAGAIQRAAFASDLLPQAITGRITDDQWRRQAVQRLQAQFPDADVATAVAAWSASAGEIDASALDLVRACRGTVPVVLITNATSRLPLDLIRLGIAEEFDHIVNSSSIGCSKPQPQVFYHALGLVGVPPAQALFVDDTEGHVAAATQVGLQGHVHTGHEQLRAVLERYLLLSPSS
jgi:putative hydrolase of the HAD superfamily